MNIVSRMRPARENPDQPGGPCHQTKSPKPGLRKRVHPPPAQAAGARPDHRRRRRRSQRHRHLQPGRGPVRLQPAVDHAADLPADGGDPDGQRPGGPRHRPGPGVQYGPGNAAPAGAGPAGAAVHRQHHQCRRRPGGDGRSGQAGHRPQPACLHHRLRHSVAGAAAVHSLSQICPLPDGADLQPVRLCRHHVSAAAGLEGNRRRADRAASQSDRKRRHHHRGDLRHHHQPLSVLLAERPGGRGSGPGCRCPSPDRTAARGAAQRSRASGSTPSPACWPPT